MMRLHKILLTLVCFTVLSAHAQWKWLNPLECGFPVIQNQGWTEEIGDRYVRLPQRAEGKVRKPVWDLSRNSAGLAIHFFSNAPELKVRYQVSGPLNMPHMPTTGVSGVDLYSIDSDGQWRFYFGGYPSGDTLQYHYTNIGKDMYHDRGYEFRLYLPPYNTIKWLEIGVPENDELTFIPVSPEKPILLYGTSIAQGACASRPGMTWGTILQRSLGYPLINLGFSGNGRLEKEVLDFICEIDARLYILDCLPNLTPKSKDEITQLVSDAVKQIRATHSSPILLVEHAGYSYQVSGPLNMPHMPTTGVSGVDLYSIDSDGQWRFYFGGYPSGDTLQYHYTNIGKDMYHDRGYEFRLYLPPYNTIKWLEIGVPENDELTFIPVSPEKPILLYGTSIAQGACASRPGMTWGTILQRSLGYPLINLGFSGNGRLEKEVLDFICEIDARLYILDCLPNLTPKSKDEITQLVSDAVKQIRATHSSPILLVEHAGYSNALADDTKLQDYTRMNEGAKKAFEELQAQGIKDIYYLTREELGPHPDAWVDYVHPSDWGMETQANAVERKVREILRIPEGNLSTTQPVTQRREPNNYEWQKRHRDILSLNQSNPPRRVILGNSITHFWGGEPKGPSVRGMETWEKIMRPAGFHNLGYGFDRIENVLWRVYHGELDGYKAEEVVLMIGTNNIGINNDNEIVEGIRFLLSAIKQRQPEAKIKVIGILPRRNQEERVRNLNLRIRQMAETGWYTFKNPGTKLLQEDGKINESLFSDGLHPNEEGYKQIVDEIAH